MPFDLDAIQLHLDNFADTWKNWHIVFSEFPDAIANLALFGEAADALSSEDADANLSSLFSSSEAAE